MKTTTGDYYEIIEGAPSDAMSMAFISGILGFPFPGTPPCISGSRQTTRTGPKVTDTPIGKASKTFNPVLSILWRTHNKPLPGGHLNGAASI